MKDSVLELSLFRLFIVSGDGFNLVDYDIVTGEMMESPMKPFVV